MPSILMLSLVFPPDSVSTAHLLGDIAADLARNGNKLTVISTTPHYNRDPEQERNQPLHPLFLRLLFRSEHRGITVYHVWAPNRSCSKAVRLLGWGFLHLAAVAIGLAACRKSDIVMATSPPMTIGLCGGILARLLGARAIYNIWELYPDVAVNLGVLRNRFLIWLCKRLEKLTYAANHYLCPIGPAMAAQIQPRLPKSTRLRIVPNAADIKDFHPKPRQNDFSRQHSLNGKFVVSYIGNIGKPQRLDVMIHAAERLRGIPEIEFVLIGDGDERSRIVELGKALGLPNFNYLGYLPYRLMPEVYASSDLSVVMQAADIGNDAIPSKVFKILASQRPVLAMADPKGDLARILNTANCGFVVNPGNIESFAETVLKAWKSPRDLEAMSRRGRELAESQFSRESIAEKYQQIVEELCGERAPAGIDVSLG